MEFNEFEKDLINQVSLSVEKDRSGKAIDWSYWAKHKAIKPKEAALLAYHVCPNMVCSALRIEENHLYPYQEIKELKSLLASHEKQWTLAELLRFLREYGYFVPFGMEHAVFKGKLELVDGVAIESPALINANASRTLHIMEWLERNKYNAGKNNIWLDGELRKDSPDLWGKNMETFNKWKQTTEAKPAMELLNKLKLEARTAD